MAQLFHFHSGSLDSAPIKLTSPLPGIQSGSLYSSDAPAFMLKQSRLAPNAVLPTHKAVGTVVYQIVEGSGVIYTEDDDGTVLHETAVSAGDILLSMPPHCKRRYVAGENGLAYTLFALP